MKALAVLLFGLGNVSQGTIASSSGQPRRRLRVDPRGREDAPASATPSSGIVQIDDVARG